MQGQESSLNNTTLFPSHTHAPMHTNKRTHSLSWDQNKTRISFMAPPWSAAFDMFAQLALRNGTNGSANATMSRAGVASCVVCPHVTITVSASINNQSAYLHEHQSPLKNNNRSINQIPTHPVMTGNSWCRSVSRLVLSCQWGDLQVTQSVCRAGEKETAEDGDGVRVSTPAFSTVTRCALQRPHRCFT